MSLLITNQTERLIVIIILCHHRSCGSQSTTLTGIRSRLDCCSALLCKYLNDTHHDGEHHETLQPSPAVPSLALILAIYIAVCQSPDTLFLYPWISRQHDENKTLEVRSEERRWRPHRGTTCSTALDLVLYPCWAPLLSPYGVCLRIFLKKNDDLLTNRPQVAEMK